MKTKSQHTHLAIVAALGFFAIPLISPAQESGGGLLNASPISKNMKQCVYTLDTFADQMVFRYGWEVRSNPPDPDSDELHKQMKAHAKLTNALVKTSRGKSAEAFLKAAQEAMDSVVLLQKLEKKAKVGTSVSKMIERSGPIATYILAHAAEFEVRPLIKLGWNGESSRAFAIAGAGK